MAEAKKIYLIERVPEERRKIILAAATIVATMISLRWVYKELKKDSAGTETPQLDEAQEEIEDQESKALEGLDSEERQEARRLAGLQVGALGYAEIERSSPPGAS
jgi:hypothetical protein